MRSKLCFGISFLSLFFLIYEKVNAQAPSWLWAKRAGAGGTGCSSNSIATDISGNVFITGSYNGNSMAFDTINLGNQIPSTSEMFIAKYSALGNVLWAKDAGGSDNEVGYNVATDGNGNVIVAGSFYSPTITFWSTTLTNTDSTGNTPDIFLVKFNASGNVIWEMSFGGSDDEFCNSVATDDSGNVLVTGYFKSPTITFGTTTLINDSAGYSSDIFIAKYDASGNVLWAKSAGENFEDRGCGIATDSNGDVLMTGSFSGSSITFGTTVLTNAGVHGAMFIVKYDAAGNVLWANSAGSGAGGGLSGNSVAADGNGNILVTGGFWTSTITFGTIVLTNAGNQDLFIVKYDAAGNVLWANSAGGNIDDVGKSITTDANGNVLITGYFSSSILTFGNIVLTNYGARNTFIVKYDTSGNMLWATRVGGSGIDEGLCIATDVNGNSLLTGYFTDTTIVFDPFILTHSNPGFFHSELFLAKLGTCSAYFTLYPDTIPLNWIAVNQATGVAPLTYLWDWGDSTTSTGATPSHTYNTPGYYNICLTITDAAGCTSTYCDSSTYIFRGSSNNAIITINVVLPNTTNIIEQTANENGVIVYPNPAQDLIQINSTIDFPATEIILFDASGREVMEKKFNKSAAFSVKHLTAGIYFYKIKDAKGNEVRGKVMKE
ncbi:MAG TPA: SBBP repeat-containing protein [Bacteroidia bacterium]|nr:SBBP repeat-containing protein [Bacteroidia bacterium]